MKVQRPDPSPAVSKRCPSAVQALSKHCPSLVQAEYFCVQARLGHTSDPLCFCPFEVTKSPPEFPFYNIKRCQDRKTAAKTGPAPERPSCWLSRILHRPVRKALSRILHRPVRPSFPVPRGATPQLIFSPSGRLPGARRAQLSGQGARGAASRPTYVSHRPPRAPRPPGRCPPVNLKQRPGPD